jgi:RNA recognition motif-containing protein
MTKALREMHGKYVGNRPIKVRRSTWQERQVTDTNQPLQFSAALGVADGSSRRQLQKGGAIHKKPHWKEQKKKKGMPW